MIRPATTDDLNAINQLITKAVLNWPMAHRVKRLSLPVLTYDACDMDHYQFLVATFNDQIVGVAAWDQEALQNLPNGKGALFHGLYVLPLVKGQGIGSRLMSAVFAAASGQEASGMLIKSQRVSRDYFEHQSLEALAANNDEYPWQYWKRLA